MLVEGVVLLAGFLMNYVLYARLNVKSGGIVAAPLFALYLLHAGIENVAGVAAGRGSNCELVLMADYDGEILFEGDEEPVKKSLSNVVLGRFQLKRLSQAGDFEFQISSNATVKPLAEIMVGGTGGIGSSQTVTYTETRVIVTTQAGQTVTQTQTRVRTETVQLFTTVVRTEYRTVTVTVGAGGGGGSSGRLLMSGIWVERPFDQFVFVGAGT